MQCQQPGAVHLGSVAVFARAGMPLEPLERRLGPVWGMPGFVHRTDAVRLHCAAFYVLADMHSEHAASVCVMCVCYRWTGPVLTSPVRLPSQWWLLAWPAAAWCR